MLNTNLIVTDFECFLRYHIYGYRHFKCKIQVTDTSKESEQVLLSNQLGHACSKNTIIIQRKVH